MTIPNGNKTGWEKYLFSLLQPPDKVVFLYQKERMDLGGGKFSAIGEQTDCIRMYSCQLENDFGIYFQLVIPKAAHTPTHPQ